MKWSDIQGWFDFDRLYREAVARADDGAHFVEIGAWLGRSTAYMAQQIAESGKQILFETIDTWDGGTDSPVNSTLREELGKHSTPIFETFTRNMRACGVEEIVRWVESDSANAAEMYVAESLDFVFIDGDHSAAFVRRDLENYWPKIKPDGVMAGHDIGEEEVQATVEEFCKQKKLSYYREGNSWVIEKTSVDPARILLGMPHAGMVAMDAAVAGMLHPMSAPGVNVEVLPRQTSLLASGFNSLWCTALRDDFTHFAMLHADVCPSRHWLDVLLAELKSTRADLVSVVAPIKDARGLTTTGIGHPTIPWSPLRRLTMQEVAALPPTFAATDAGYPDHALLINTGCWLADLRNPKWLETDADGALKIFFTINDRVNVVNGEFYPQVQSEDWFFSQKMFENGLKAVATRKVKLGHHGSFPWPNYVAWGKWAHDNETAPHWN